MKEGRGTTESWRRGYNRDGEVALARKSLSWEWAEGFLDLGAPAAVVGGPAQWILCALRPKKTANTDPASVLACVGVNDIDNVVNVSGPVPVGNTTWNEGERRVGRKFLNAGWFVAIP